MCIRDRIYVVEGLALFVDPDPTYFFRNNADRLREVHYIRGSMDLLRDLACFFGGGRVVDEGESCVSRAFWSTCVRRYSFSPVGGHVHACLNRL